MGEGDEEVALPAPSGLGLTEARVRAGWSLLQAADQLHLDVVSVKALEAGDFAALGAMVYARGHLRRYAELLGLPAGEIATACAQARFPERDPELKRGATGLQRRSGRGLRLPAGAAAVAATLLVLIALVWWAMRMPHVARSSSAGTTAGTSAAPSP
jgi:cytoskeletal protein RodZ